MGEYGVEMEINARPWNVFDARTPILTYPYSFGPGSANALVVGGPQGLVVVSPPCGVALSVFEELSLHGQVCALIAPNAFHHLGLREWTSLFPAAQVYAPAQSIARLEHRTRLMNIRPLAELGALTGAHLRLVDMPFYRTGEALVSAESERGLVWYLTDIVTNFAALPDHLIVKILFGLSGSAPGLRFNNIASTLMVRDKAALKRWLADEIAKARPQWLIPAHGDIVELRSAPILAQRLFARS